MVRHLPDSTGRAACIVIVGVWSCTARGGRAASHHCQGLPRGLAVDGLAQLLYRVGLCMVGMRSMTSKAKVDTVL